MRELQVTVPMMTPGQVANIEQAMQRERIAFAVMHDLPRRLSRYSIKVRGDAEMNALPEALQKHLVGAA